MNTAIFTLFFFMPLVTVLFGIDVALVSGQCQSSQQSLLLQLKGSLHFNQSKSTKMARWISTTDCCKWAGINCDNSGRVTGLDLSNESISGGLEKSPVFSLQFLERLNLSFNSFNSSLPPGFANFTSLVALNLSNAGFSGQIPNHVSRLTNLVSLDLSTLYFPGVLSLKLENPNLATLIRNLTQLRELYLDGVNISAQGNEWCQALSSSLPNLQVLSLSNCFLSGPFDPSLKKLQSLTYIRLDQNNLSAEVPKFFGNFSNLITLRLSSCRLNGTFPKDVFHIRTLETLDLSNNPLLLGYLSNNLHSISLKSLVLSDTNFSGGLPLSSGNLGNLSRIEIPRCNFIGPLPSSMANINQLVYLDLSSNKFTGPIPSFNMSKNLIHLDLSHNQLTGEIASTKWAGLLNLIYLDLKNNSLTGSIPSSLFAIPSLQKLQLSLNQFGGQVPGFLSASFSSLDTLDLSHNKLEGLIPPSVFAIKRLNVLILSFNKFNGTIQLDQIQERGNLTNLDLSYNNLTVKVNTTNSNLPLFPKLNTLKLASCNLIEFPDLSKQSKIVYLDISDNQINGSVPSWVWKLGNGTLLYLDLSKNRLVDLEQPYSIPPTLTMLDLNNNQLQGKIPPLPPLATYVDYSSNNFASDIPENIGSNLTVTIFFSLSKNSLNGAIPQSICYASYLQVLDLSNNNLNGKIPECLIQMSQTLRVLNLRRNNFSDSIPDKFPDSCELKTLDLRGNQFHGKVPQSLINCTMLEVLDLGNNQIDDKFPCLLRKISTLRVLVLRNNKFSGTIACHKSEQTWKNLQIVDLASNNFSDKIPEKCLTTWKAMMEDGNQTNDHLRFTPLWFTQLYYQDSITVTSKGLEMELVKILTVFTSIDLSCNNFEGPIPRVIGNFTALHVLNLSHNALTSEIPSSLGNLSNLESLDLSRNNLTGVIPQQLARLTFLSFLNVSHNRLFGRIPTSTQLQSFLPTSFEYNPGLCGPPLLNNCISIASPPARQQYQRMNLNWEFLPGMGFGLGAGAVVAPIMFCKEVNKWYNKHIDRVLLVLLPMLGLTYYTSDDWRAPGNNSNEDTKDDGNDDDGDDYEEDEYEDDFEVRYCVFCTKFDITTEKVIHDPKCNCNNSPPISSTSSSSLSSSSS